MIRLTLFAVALAIVAGPAARAAVVIRGPYLQQTSDRATFVRWRTDQATYSVVAYGSTPGALDQQVSIPILTTEHEVQLTGLASDTVYHYAVGSASATLAGDDGEHHFRTHPPRGNSRDDGVVFWITGDQGARGSIADRVRDKALAVSANLGWNYDAWLALGDNAYSQGGLGDGTDAAYQAGMFDLFPEVLRKASIWPCVGNHDVGGPDGGTNHDAVFTLPTNAEMGGMPSGTERYYSFDVGNVHLVSLQWDNGVLPDDPMAVWLVADLAQNTQPWTVVFWHGPPHTFGSHNSDWENSLIAYRQSLTPILAAYGVDLVLSGHSHNYERSALVDSWFDGDSIDFLGGFYELDSGDGRADGDGAYVKTTDNGVVYAVVGNSAKGGAPINQPHPVVRFTQAGNGSALLRVTCDRLEFRYVDQYNGITDAFDIVKAAACDPVGGTADILWRRPASGHVATWLLDGTEAIGGGSPGFAPGNWTIVGTGDFDADGRDDILWRRDDGLTSIWLLDGAQQIGAGSPGFADPDWLTIGTGDFDGDGRRDILWRHAVTGQVVIWYIDGTQRTGFGLVGTANPDDWVIVGIGDFDHLASTTTPTDDILWRHTASGQTYIWLMDGASIVGHGSPGGVGQDWQIAGTGDFDGDDHTDILWRHALTGQVVIWLVHGTSRVGQGSPGQASATLWQIVGTGDFDGDRRHDVLWRHQDNGLTSIWFIDGTDRVGDGVVGVVGLEWSVAGTGNFDGN